MLRLNIVVIKRCPEQFNRLISTSNHQLAKDASLGRQSKIMAKLFGGRVIGNKTRWYPDSEKTSNQSSTTLFNASTFGKQNSGQSKATSRRRTVLNKLFMRHISDLLATGEASQKIVGKGLQISRIKITQDFGTVNVFWIISSDEHLDEMEKELKLCGGILRHELSQLRLMGEVPRINFVHDKTYFKTVEIEKLLQTLDLDSDEENLEKGNQLREDLNLNKNYESTTCDSNFDDQIPVMRHDIFGLDHKRIMSSILTKMKKSKQAWDQYETRNKNQESPIDNQKKSCDSLEKVQLQISEQNTKSSEFESFLLKRKERRPLKTRTFDKSDPLIEQGLNPLLSNNEVCDPTTDGDYIDENIEDK